MSRLEVRNLSFAYGPRAVLKGIDLSLPAGKRLALLGPNGSGKSTLLRILATLLNADEGAVSVEGVTIQNHLPQYRRALGVVFQSAAVDKRLTIEENLRAHAHTFGLSWRDVQPWAMELIDRLGIGERSRDYVKTLSGGLERRVELAKALVHRPSLLLLDEPTASLDPGARVEFWKLLEQLREELNLTVVASTHLLEEAADFDLLLLLDDGQSVAFGDPSVLLSELGGEIVQLQGSSLAAVGTLARERFKTEIHSTAKSLRFVLPEGETMGSTLEWLRGVDEQLTEVSISRPGLQDLYAARTGKHWEIRS